ncbi:MAG: radical SAM/SPASM domain-containing protein [Alphaproteobacteria bacterium]
MSQQLDGTKLFHHVDALARWKRGETVYPIQIEISPTKQCNHKCLFCYYEYTARDSVFLDRDVWRGLLEDGSKLGCKAVFYSGEGEPLLHKDLPEMVNLGARLGIDQALNTNATPLTDTVIKSVLPHMTWIRISVNGVDADDYARVHQAPSSHFEVALRNTAAAVSFKRSQGLDVVIGVQMIYIGQPMDKVMRLAERIRDIGGDYFSLKPGMPHPDNPVQFNGPLPSLQEISRVKELALPGFQVEVRWGLREQEWKRPYKRCLSLPFFAEVTADGRVYACGPHLNDPKFCYGSLHEMDLKALWSHENRAKVEDHVCAIEDLDHVCMPLCRLDQVNRFLWALENPPSSVNFI